MPWGSRRVPGSSVVPPCHDRGVELPPSLRFADASRVLTGTALQLGLAAPTFRSPPRMAGATRTIRRLAEPTGSTGQKGPRGTSPVGSAPAQGVGPTPSPAPRPSVVAVSLRGRAFAEVLADMIEGVIVANRLDAVEAQRVRAQLFRAANEVFDVEAA
jgi:hypothetical protein